MSRVQDPPAVTRQPARGDGQERRSRGVLAAVVAFVVALAGFALAIAAFRTGHAPRPAASVANGKIAFQTLDRGWLIAVIDPDGTDLEILTDPLDVDGTELDLAPLWSPDGTRIAFSGYTNHDPETGNGDYELFVMSADGSGMTNLTGDSGANYPFTWSPDGMALAFSRFQGDDQHLFLINADGSGERALTEGPGHDYSPTWSPDGTSIAFVHWMAGEGYDIYSVDPKGGPVLQLSDVEGYHGSPVWSPDGSKIAFVSNRKGVLQIYVMNADGTEPTKLTSVPTDGSGCCIGSSLAWSPDGTRIAFDVWDYERGDWNIWAVNADGTEQVRLTDDPGDENGASWSPDGARMAFTASPLSSSEGGDNAGTFDIYLMNPDGTGRTRLTNDAHVSEGDLSWRPAPPAGAEGPTPEPTPTSAETAPPSVDSNPSATLQIAPTGQASSLLYAFGSVWVAWHDESGSKITRIDASTNEVVATIPIEDGPGWTGGGGGMAEGYGSIWVSGSSLEGGILQWIDPTTNRLAATIQLHGRSPSIAADVAVGENGIWVATMPLDDGGSSSLQRVDPETNEVVAEIPLQYEYERRVVPVSGAILVRQLHWHDDESGPYTIFTAIDARTNTIVANTAEDMFGGIWAWNDEVWALDGRGLPGPGLVRIDPKTLSALGDPVPIESSRLGSFGVGEGGIWFVGAAGIDHWKPPITVNRLNPETGQIDVSVEVPKARGVDMALGGDAIWFLTFDGELVRFDLT